MTRPGNTEVPRRIRHAGRSIEVGDNSPLLHTRARRLIEQPTEEAAQVSLMRTLVGPARPGEDRRPGDGMTGQHPELLLLYAVPNAGAGPSRGMAARMKAMGALRGMCDLVLPVMRGPFIGLYLELKRGKGKSRPEQRHVQNMLAHEGHCIAEAHGAAEAAAMILGYLALPKNRVSARPIPRDLLSLETIDQRIAEWKRQCYAMLKPEQP